MDSSIHHQIWNHPTPQILQGLAGFVSAFLENYGEGPKLPNSVDPLFLEENTREMLENGFSIFWGGGGREWGRGYEFGWKFLL